MGRFNIKEAIGIMNENHRQEKEEKWTKIWGGNWWPKIATFCCLVIKRRILT